MTVLWREWSSSTILYMRFVKNLSARVLERFIGTTLSFFPWKTMTGASIGEYFLDFDSRIDKNGASKIYFKILSGFSRA